MKKAFTLIEMLVVVGIIGILAAVLLGTFSGSTESAKSARCLSNLRNLAAAVHNYAMTEGFYPLAGSIEKIKVGSNGSGGMTSIYFERPGWICWYSNGKYNKYTKSSQHSKSWMVSMYSSAEDARLFALTNGVLWKYLSGSREVYVCPTHALAKKDAPPAWSYVMNCEFGYTSNFSLSYDSSFCGQSYSGFRRADKTLLFGEIPFADAKMLKLKNCIPPVVASGNNNEACDCVLDYKHETMGFNHKVGRHVSGNVAYADGHCEKLAYPVVNGVGMDETKARELTEWLCKGFDISFDGSKYDKVISGQQ